MAGRRSSKTDAMMEHLRSAYLSLNKSTQAG